MTPLEINLKIAKLKNIEVLQTIASKIYYKGESEYAKRGLTQYAAEPLKSYNWAESIQDAWGLFEDLKFRSVSYDERCHYWICEYAAETSYSDRNEEFVISYDYENAETAPLAICLAWIKWKESQK